jgi:hypothetical protein
VTKKNTSTAHVKSVKPLAGTIQHYCDRCHGRVPADSLNVVWGRVVCDGCLSPNERQAKEIA